MNAGYTDEARAWRDWLLRAVAGDPATAADHVRRRRRAAAHRVELAWLPGYEGSRPVRIGNAAHEQFQLDVYGEVMDALHQARRARARARRRTPGRCSARCCEFLETRLARARRGHLGGARRRAATSPTRR